METYQKMQKGLSALTMLSIMGFAQNALAQSTIDSLRLEGLEAVQKLSNQASSNFIPVYFAYTGFDSRHWGFPNRVVGDYQELQSESILEALEIRGNLSKSLYQKNVKLVLVEVDPRKDKDNSTAGTGLIFLQNESGNFETIPLKISPFAFGRKYGPLQPDRTRRWELAFFMIIGDSRIGTNDAITRIGSELKTAVSEALKISPTTNGLDEQNRLDDSEFFEELIAPFSYRNDQSVGYFGDPDEFLKNVLNHHSDSTEALRTLSTQLKNKLSNFEKLASLKLPGWMSTHQKDLRTKFSSTDPIRNMVHRVDLAYHVANLAEKYSPVSISNPDVNSVDFKKYASITEQEIASRMRPLERSAKQFEAQLAILEDQKKRLEYAKNKVEEYKQFDERTTESIELLDRSIASLQAIVTSHPDKFRVAHKKFEADYNHAFHAVEQARAMQEEKNRRAETYTPGSSAVQSSTSSNSSHPWQIAGVILAGLGGLIGIGIASLMRKPSGGASSYSSTNNSSSRSSTRYEESHTPGGEAQARSGNNNNSD